MIKAKISIWNKSLINFRICFHVLFYLRARFDQRSNVRIQNGFFSMSSRFSGQFDSFCILYVFKHQKALIWLTWHSKYKSWDTKLLDWAILRWSTEAYFDFQISFTRINVIFDFLLQFDRYRAEILETNSILI